MNTEILLKALRDARELLREIPVACDSEIATRMDAMHDQIQDAIWTFNGWYPEMRAPDREAARE
jgi:hypothetical protein